MQSQWTCDEIALLSQHYTDALVSSTELEQVFKRQWSAIREKARSLGLHRPRLNYKQWTTQEVMLLRQYYPDCRIYPAEMEKIFKRSWGTIAMTAQNMGLRRARDLYNIDRGYFNDVKTDSQSHWLGLLAADGNVSNNIIVLELNNKDRILVEQFRDEIAPDSPIYEHPKTNSCRIQVASMEMCNDLTRYNIVPNKSSVFTWPMSLPEHLAMSFLLGYFDGDGSFFQYTKGARRYWRWYLVGTEAFLSTARDYIQQCAQVELAKPRRCHKGRSPHLYTIQADKQETIKRIDRVLNISGLGLPRKHF
jgi:hypothetical protein